MLQEDILQLSLLSRDMEGMKLIYCNWCVVTGIALYNQGKVQLIRKVSTMLYHLCYIFFFLKC